MLGINKAHDILSDPRKRSDYDNHELKQHKDQNELVQNDTGERFAQNAYNGNGNGNGNGDDSDDSDDSDDDEDDEDGPLSDEKTKLLGDMEPLVKQYFESRDNRLYQNLSELGEKIKELNKKENKDRNDKGKDPISVLSHTPPLVPIKKGVSGYISN